jgi:hypothetical protein
MAVQDAATISGIHQKYLIGPVTDFLMLGGGAIVILPPLAPTPDEVRRRTCGHNAVADESNQPSAFCAFLSDLLSELWTQGAGRRLPSQPAAPLCLCGYRGPHNHGRILRLQRRKWEHTDAWLCRQHVGLFRRVALRQAGIWDPHGRLGAQTPLLH